MIATLVDYGDYEGNIHKALIDWHHARGWKGITWEIDKYEGFSEVTLKLKSKAEASFIIRDNEGEQRHINACIYQAFHEILRQFKEDQYPLTSYPLWIAGWLREVWDEWPYKDYKISLSTGKGVSRLASNSYRHEGD